ncbi:MAG: HPF/RaiA family ribosome-associated protein [Chthoniobacteraceae bacterium]
MKLILTHRHHEPSPSFTALVKERLESLREALQIDEARIFIERRLEASPAFLVTAHLVTPGPDVFAEAVDHTLRAALGKMFGKLEARIDHRHQKRARRVPNPLKKTAPAQLTSAGTRL